LDEYDGKNRIIEEEDEPSELSPTKINKA